MKKLNQTIVILQKLSRTQVDRIQGYERAIQICDDEDLKHIFKDMIRISEDLHQQLSGLLLEMGFAQEKNNTLTGKAYATWMQIKNKLLPASQRHQVLQDCEFGEDMAQRVYSDVLSGKEKLPIDVYKLLLHQQKIMKSSYDRIHHLRNIF
ncbi:hypothetical protein COR50_04385 [Chitinophaga caeni]|uniref:DUF2383 domain-containing protein n=1 Tax=Chitinophaga caeni TaxID=2029983 RepID=A0A291QRK8_9BACT|nr:PA2169 family four-helix-bundle protein [Chitinophaga caeni]ATL46474.1 hypothetical protein COR50_04385 [Chitinophaga caeni]